MNFGTLSRLAEDLSAKIGTYRGALERTDHAEALDWAMKLLAQRCAFYDPKVNFTLTADQAEYRLNSSTVFGRRIVKPYTVVVNSNPLVDASRCHIGLWTVNELNEVYSKWRTDSSGTPIAAVVYSGKLRLYPAPNIGAVSTGNCFVEGEIVPGWIKTDGSYSASGAAGLVTGSTWDLTAEPDLADQYHELLAVLAAIKLAQPEAESEQAWATLGSYNADLAVQVERLERENRAQITAWGSLKPSDRTDRYLRLG